jgi:CarD family transcriptional regulator
MVNDNAGVTALFQPDDYVVYPTHGVGKVLSVEESEIAGQKMELLVISFEHEKMTLRVPTYKVETSGMRKVANEQDMELALEVLKGRARVKRVMWSRRAQEYEAKINSGDLCLIAEVVRDLHKGSVNTEQSYSERQLYEIAFERLSRELAIIHNFDKELAGQHIHNYLCAKAA